jgi:hypothetical protein
LIAPGLTTGAFVSARELAPCGVVASGSVEVAIVVRSKLTIAVMNS